MQVRRGVGAGWSPGYFPGRARNKQTPDFDIEVDGEPDIWRLQRQPQWSSDTNSFQGMAIAAGWEPLSRGKTVAIVVDADGS